MVVSGSATVTDSSGNLPMFACKSGGSFCKIARSESRATATCGPAGTLSGGGGASAATGARSGWGGRLDATAAAGAVAGFFLKERLEEGEHASQRG